MCGQSVRTATQPPYRQPQLVSQFHEVPTTQVPQLTLQPTPHVLIRVQLRRIRRQTNQTKPGAGTG